MGWRCLPGSRVAVQVEKSPEALMLYLARCGQGWLSAPETGLSRRRSRVFSERRRAGRGGMRPARNCGWIAAGRKYAYGACLHAGCRRQRHVPDGGGCQPDLMRSTRCRASPTIWRRSCIPLAPLAAARARCCRMPIWRPMPRCCTITGVGAGRRAAARAAVFHVHGLFVATHGALLAAPA